ncbi:hypothetical protein ACN47E_001003 [Coniothyrium glycines]
MPRIATSLLRKAHVIDPFLPALLAPCRDLHVAQNELRWLREHVQKVVNARRVHAGTTSEHALLRQLVKERAAGKPIQYLLGTEYFGNLEIRCKPGVLIPRADTAASITYLVDLLRHAKSLPRNLRVLDLCTGTGCIPLLFHHELYRARNDINLHLLGVDISGQALRLAKSNREQIRKDTQHGGEGQIVFMRADILAETCANNDGGPHALRTALDLYSQPAFWDILISNPPYISPSDYWKTTTRSVRGYEPKLALVPPTGGQESKSDADRGDLFYPRLLNIARDTGAKIVLLEVADIEQARRVATYAAALDIFVGIEILCDQPGSSTSQSTEGHDVKIIGEGNARSVLCWRAAGASWLGKRPAVPKKNEESVALRHPN